MVVGHDHLDFESMFVVMRKGPFEGFEKDFGLGVQDGFYGCERCQDTMMRKGIPFTKRISTTRRTSL